MVSSTSTRLRKPLALAATVVGLVGGSYGVAAAASGSASGSSSSSSGTSTAPAAPAVPAAPPGAGSGRPFGGRRSDETPLTGAALAKVKAAALAHVGSGATVVRIETDADGHAAYEAHMQKADGTPVTVYVNKSYEVVSTGSPF
jgi:hypothetical protein